MQEGSKKAIAAAFVANLGIAIAKFIGFAITASSSMLAEGIHSVADTSNQGLLFLGGAKARRAPSATHPFGYARERYFWSFIVSLVLFSVGGLFAVYEGYEKLRHPEHIDSPAVAFAILGVAIVLEAFSLRTAVREARPLRGDRSWWRFVREAKTPELPVVLLEDLGALVGLVFAVCGVGLAVATGNDRWDAVGSIAIGLLLIVIAVVLANEMRSLLMGEAADPDTLERMRAAIVNDESVRRVIHLRTQHLGPDDLLVAAKVEFAPHLAGAELADAVDAAETRLRSAAPIARLVFLEPDIYRPEDTLSD
ncbi:MAG: cation diffusion facilitator family transporter [Acidimicrobiia bacterium]|nr:cation diffusion facilitator family transporter [Acidimicrobiia bacterium]